MIQDVIIVWVAGMKQKIKYDFAFCLIIPKCIVECENNETKRSDNCRRQESEEIT